MLVIIKMLVASDAVSQVDFAREAAFGKYLHGSVDGRVAYSGVLLSHRPVDILDASVAFIFQENVENQLTVRRELKLAFLQVFHEHLHLGRKNLHGVDDGSNLTTSL